MRIRSTKPEFWRSERIARVDWDARLVLKGLESFVDDNGVGRDDLPLIVSDLFSRDLVREPSRTVARVSEAISHLHEAGLVHRYEYEGTRLLYLSFWESVQRVDKPHPGRFPRPDGTWGYKDSMIGEPNGNVREASRTLAPGTEEQRNRGTEEQISCAPADADRESAATDDEFDEWYALYPRKKGKGQAVKAYRTARKTATAEQLLDGLRSQLPALLSKEASFIPYPATWLNGQRWDDEEDAPTTGRPSERADVYAGLQVVRVD